MAGSLVPIVRAAHGDDASAAARRRVEPARRPAAQDDRADRRQGFPGAIHVPMLKQLFSGNDDSIDQTDIVMLLTPHIVRTHEITESDLKPIYIGSQQNLGVGGPPPLIARPTGPAPPVPPRRPRRPAAPRHPAQPGQRRRPAAGQHADARHAAVPHGRRCPARWPCRRRRPTASRTGAAAPTGNPPATAPRATPPAPTPRHRSRRTRRRHRRRQRRRQRRRTRCRRIARHRRGAGHRSRRRARRSASAAGRTRCRSRLPTRRGCRR